MANLTDLIRQRDDVCSELYYLIDNTVNSSGFKYVLGPFTRSRAYSLRREYVNSSSPFVWSIFKFHDCIDKYFLVFVDDNTGRILYESLVNHRSLVKRLEKEIDKL